MAFKEPLPSDYARIRRVTSFDELVSTPMAKGVNALYWERDLEGDFAEIAGLIPKGEDIIPLDKALLQSLPLGPGGRLARDLMLEDHRLLSTHGLAPSLDCIHAYPRDEDDGLIPTHVYSFHADSATVEADTYLCTYFGPTSEGLRNEEAQRRIDDPSTRARLLEQYGGQDDEGFLEYLEEHCYHLHYVPLPRARPFSFGLGNLWRIAIAHPASEVPPCVHRAPITSPGQSRLLLIS